MQGTEIGIAEFDITALLFGFMFSGLWVLLACWSNSWHITKRN
jgi:hypothetical protein